MPLAAPDREQLDQVATLVRHVLGDGLVGAYLHGSTAHGELRPRSDLDLLVVARRPTSREEKRRLVDGLVVVSGRDVPGPPRPVELTVVAEREVRPWRYPPRFDFQYGEWLRRDFETHGVEPWPTTTSPDLASLLTMVLRADAPLHGPPPGEVLEPVPHADLVAALLAGVGPLLDDLDTDTRNAILTFARIWTTLATGAIRSKDEAADWALRRLPQGQRPPLARARAVYLGEEEERWDDLRPLVRPYANHVVGEIERLAPR